MKFIDKGFVVLVYMRKEDIERFNAQEQQRLPHEEVIVGVLKDSGKIGRIIPSSVKQDMCWERLADFARSAMYKEHLGRRGAP